MGALTGITIKLPEATLRRLREQARQSGQSVASLVRARLEAASPHDDGSVYALSADLAGSLDGGTAPATNARRRFRRR